MRTQVVNAGDPLVIAQVISVAGAGIGSLTVLADIQRINDGKYWNGSAWQTGTSPRTMTANADITGLYQYSIAAAALDGADYALAFPGYFVKISETTTAFFDVLQVVPMVDLNQATLANSLTVFDALKRLVALRQDNVHAIYDTWQADGKPSHGYLYLYNSKAAADSDTPPYSGAVAKYEWTGAYDGLIRLTGYISTRIS